MIKDLQLIAKCDQADKTPEQKIIFKDLVDFYNDCFVYIKNNDDVGRWEAEARSIEIQFRNFLKTGYI